MKPLAQRLIGAHTILFILIDALPKISLGFEKHYMHGKKKMKIRCGLTLCVMLAMGEVYPFLRR